MSATPSGESDERWVCATCSFVYDPAEGFYDRETGVQYDPYTAWEALADEVICPDCGAPKASFRKLGPDEAAPGG